MGLGLGLYRVRVRVRFLRPHQVGHRVYDGEAGEEDAVEAVHVVEVAERQELRHEGPR